MAPVVGADSVCEAHPRPITVCCCNEVKGPNLTVVGSVTPNTLFLLGESVNESKSGLAPAAAIDINIISPEVKVNNQRSHILTNIYLKTLELSATNQQLEKELAELREQTRKFVESVKANRPETLTLSSSSTLLHQGGETVQLP